MTLTGVLAPVPTPFDNADRLDTKCLKRALRHWLTSSLTGFVILGSTGEAPLLDDAEADRAVAAARDVVPRTRTFMVGTGRESTASAIRAAKRAGRLGADAVLVRTPGFFKNQLTSEALVGHYRAIADASPVPVLLYQFPALTGVSLETHAVRQLAAHPNIVGLKDSSGDVLQISDFVSSCGDTFRVLTGSASTFYTAVCMGAAGGILALSCVLPEACVRLFTLAREGRHDEGRALQQRLLPVAKLVGSAYGVPGLKAALQIVGVDIGPPRRPLLPASEEAVGALREELAGTRRAAGMTTKKTLRALGRWTLGAAGVGFAALAYVYLTLPDVRSLATVNPTNTAFMELRAQEARAKGLRPRRVQRWIATAGSRRSSSARSSSLKTTRSGSTRAWTSSSCRNRWRSTGRAADWCAAAARSRSSWRRTCTCRRRRTRLRKLRRADHRAAARGRAEEGANPRAVSQRDRVGRRNLRRRGGGADLLPHQRRGPGCHSGGAARGRHREPASAQSCASDHAAAQARSS